MVFCHLGVFKMTLGGFEGIHRIEPIEIHRLRYISTSESALGQVLLGFRKFLLIFGSFFQFFGILGGYKGIFRTKRCSLDRARRDMIGENLI